MRIDTTTLSRLFRTAIHPFWGMVPKAPQKAIYKFGHADQVGLEGGVPQWIIMDVPNVASGDTVESALRLPAYFSLLSVVGWSNEAATPPTGNDFMVELYDDDTEMPLIFSGVKNGPFCGFAGNVLADLYPFCFRAAEASIQCRLTNLANVAANLQFGLYGVMGGQRS